ncbi:HD domain-containing protein [Vibrio sp. DW001]|uniref:HD-GYP domain-containing protein n=1 Tax=Vibrio sp. DW001 TaxID=2912315 RepID=UPI0023B1935B|nr:HD domain-containing phosphohydrolase [Vibrio sp. DW001]WED27797.1 HD domain-containing protein [Vibrio sp. DW001]
MLNTLNERTKPHDDTAIDSHIALLGDDVLLILVLLPLIISFFYAMYRHTSKARVIAQRELALTKVKQEAFDLQKNILTMMGKAIECRSGETGSHVKRVAQLSYYVGKLYGLSDAECEVLKVISPMHDIGKIAISEKILDKPGKLNHDEFEVMKRHTTEGYKLLSSGRGHLMEMAAIVAHEHHEKWDGSGYPNGKVAEEIHIYGRITAIVDVIDALLSQRPYKEPWSVYQVKELLKGESGKHFQPELVDLILAHFSNIIDVRNAAMTKNEPRQNNMSELEGNGWLVN